MRKSTNKFEIVGDILKITTASGRAFVIYY